MPGVDGIKTAKEVIARNKDIIIIFLSSSGDHYSEAYDLFAFNYIRKPFEQEKLYAVLDRAIAKLEKQSGYKIRIQHKSTIQNVDCREILYIESRNRLLFFHLADKSVLQCYGKLDKLILNLPDKLFLRCHQSFVVNPSHIVEMGEGYFRIGEERIDISRKYLKTVKEQYYTYLFSNMSGGQLL
jgi:DNA-binding LytR/AlgR family response regulator